MAHRLVQDKNINIIVLVFAKKCPKQGTGIAVKLSRSLFPCFSKSLSRFDCAF